MANCQYTFEVEKGTRVQYNFADLERQLTDRILFSKSVIDMPLTEVIWFLFLSQSLIQIDNEFLLLIILIVHHGISKGRFVSTM